MKATALRCVRCGTTTDPDGPFKGCVPCDAEGRPTNTQVVYDEEQLVAAVQRTALKSSTPANMWHYRELLPIDAEHITTLGEGGTPLLPVPRLGAKLGIPRLHVKDESRNPTGSFKDRLASGSIGAALQLGRKVVVGSSSGNAGAAVAASAARAHIPCVMFTTQRFPLAMKTQMAVYGAYLLAAPTVADRWSLMETGVDRFNWFPVTVFRYPFFGSNPYGIEGYKTIGYEIVDQLSQAPSDIVFPVGAGDAFSGAFKGLSEYERGGAISAMPRMHAAEVFGPLERAIAEGSDVVEAVDTKGATTVAISVGSNLSTFQALDVLRRTGGMARSASDPEMLAAQRDLASLEGIWVETSSALSVAALPRLVAEGAVDPDGVVVAVLTSTGLKDPDTTAGALADIPNTTAEFDDTVEVLKQAYGFDATKDVHLQKARRK